MNDDQMIEWLNKLAKRGATVQFLFNADIREWRITVDGGSTYHKNKSFRLAMGSAFREDHRSWEEKTKRYRR